MEFIGQEIDAVAYDVLWEQAMPGLAKPAVLDGDSPGDTAEERRRIELVATERLRQAGYLGALGVSDEAAKVLNIIGRPQLAVDVRSYECTGWDSEQTGLARTSIRVAVHSWRGAVAVIRNGKFQAWSFPATSLIHEVIRQFHPYDSQRRFAGVSLYPDQLAPHSRPHRRGWVETTLHLLEGPYLRRAYLNATGSNGTSAALLVNDVHTGRFLVFRDRNQVNIVPGNRATFERKLKELIEPLRRS